MDESPGAERRLARATALAHGMLDLAPARRELEQKEFLDIERATALTWGARCAVYFQMAGETREPHRRQRRLQEAENCRQEAIEHAAMTEDLEFLVALRKEMDEYRKPALSAAA